MMLISIFARPDGKLISFKGMYEGDVFRKVTKTWIVSGREKSTSKLVQFKYIKTIAVFDKHRDVDAKHVFV